MDFFYDDNTPIIACSSGNSSNTGISLIRISGFDDPSIFSSVLSINFSSLKYRYSYYSNLIFNDEVTDSVLAVFFKGPNSFNGENILELSVHGNILNVERIIAIKDKEVWEFRRSKTDRTMLIDKDNVLIPEDMVKPYIIPNDQFSIDDEIPF